MAAPSLNPADYFCPMIPTLPFGRTGHTSSRIVFGAAALGGMSESRSWSTLELVTAAGVNHIDTAASYGHSEDRLRPWLAQKRDSVFLATKTGERDGSGARRELERSLDRMGVDSIDLIQLHNLVEADEWERAFAPDGAVVALAKARDEGIVSHIGVTGHGLRIPARHLESLDRFDFDSVLFPVNPTLLAIDSYRRDVERLVARCLDRSVAMQTIKSVARRRWSDGPGGHRSWYEPITDPAAIATCVRFVLAHPYFFLNTTSDATLLPHVIAAAQGDLAAPSADDIARLVADQSMSPLFDGADLERI